MYMRRKVPDSKPDSKALLPEHQTITSSTYLEGRFET